MRTNITALAVALLAALAACSSLPPPGGAMYMAPSLRAPDTVQVLPVQFERFGPQDQRTLERAFIDSLRASGRVATVRYDSAPSRDVAGLVRLLARQRDSYHLPDSARVCQLSGLLGTRYLLYVKFSYSRTVNTYDKPKVETRNAGVRAELWDGMAGRLVWSGGRARDDTPLDVGHGWSLPNGTAIELVFEPLRQLLAELFTAPRRNGNPRL